VPILRGRAAASRAPKRLGGRYPRRVSRRCFRVGCQSVPVATLSYNYARSTAMLGPLSPEHDPGGYDLCLQHARNLQVPAGWQLERMTAPPQAPSSAPSFLTDLADEVRRIGWGDYARPAPQPDPAGVVELGRRGHLRVIADMTSAR